MFILNSPRHSLEFYEVNEYKYIFYGVHIFQTVEYILFFSKKNIDRFYSCEFHGWFLLEYNDGTRVKPGYVTQEIFYIA